MPRHRSKLIHKKQTKKSNYTGVDWNKNKWIVKMTIRGKKYVFGPFDKETDAAKFYDTEALKNFKEKARLNILDNPYVKKEKPKNIDKNVNKNKNKMNINKRVKFSVVTKNKICAKQKWCCNYCGNLLSDIFIVDHIIPLFIGGSNSEYNLQALCPSCDRFKTSYLDYKVIKPLSEIKKLSVDDVFQIQHDNYHKMMCIDPKSSTVNNTETMNINCHQYITNSNINSEPNNRNILEKGLELNINGTKIRIQV